MIPDAVLNLVAQLLHDLVGALPISTPLALPDAVEFGTMIGSRVGPFNQILPLSEIMTQTVIFVTVALPAIITYQVTFWIYRHLPIIGKG